MTEPKQGILTYCLICKDFTETILIPIPGPIPGFGKIGASKTRICKKCARPKKRTTLETEEE